MKSKIKLMDEIKSANRAEIQEAIARLKRYWRRGRWLSSPNPYRKNAVNKLNSQIRSAEGLSARNRRYLIEYIAASSLIHCFDGWAYLGRAINAEMIGDVGIAQHLGYYAELRGAISIFASEGIGVFSSKHVIVKNSNECKILENVGGTHKFVQEIFRTLGTADNEVSVFNVLLKVIKPYGNSLDSEISILLGDRAVRARKYSIASHWIKKWGSDMERFIAIDHDARNNASYRPSTFKLPNPQPVETAIESLKKIWQIVEPGFEGGFPNLDQYMLEYSMKKLKRGYQNESNSAHLKLIENAFNRNTDHTQGLLIRAILLLRIATGVAEMLLRESDINWQDLKFWWSSPSVNRCLWPDENYPDNFSDMWSEIDTALEQISEWKTTKESKTYYDLWQEHAPEAALLSTTERICLWGIEL